MPVTRGAIVANARTVLVIEDNLIEREGLAAVLRKEPHVSHNARLAATNWPSLAAGDSAPGPVPLTPGYKLSSRIKRVLAEISQPDRVIGLPRDAVARNGGDSPPRPASASSASSASSRRTHHTSLFD